MAGQLKSLSSLASRISMLMLINMDICKRAQTQIKLEVLLIKMKMTSKLTIMRMKVARKVTIVTEQK